VFFFLVPLNGNVALKWNASGKFSYWKFLQNFKFTDLSMSNFKLPWIKSHSLSLSHPLHLPCSLPLPLSYLTFPIPLCAQVHVYMHVFACVCGKISNHEALSRFWSIWWQVTLMNHLLGEGWEFMRWRQLWKYKFW
jgi:hypothetical protein